MNFGNVGYEASQLWLIPLLAWLIPIALLIWFIRTLSDMARSLRDIADRIGTTNASLRTPDQRPRI